MTPEELAERRKGIGASDANKIIAGGEAWYELFMIKTGRKPDEDLSDVWAVQLGKTTEDLNLDWYEKKKGYILGSRQQKVISHEYPILRATLDGFDPLANAVIEAKHVNGFSKMPDVVARYTPQVLHQMLCAQVPHGFLSVIVGANEPVLTEIEWDEFWVNEYVDRCGEFWQFVIEDKEPPGAPAALAPPIALDKMRKVDMTGNNEFATFAADWKENAKSAKRFDAAVKGIKGLVEADVCEARGYGVVASRDKRGVSIKET